MSATVIAGGKSATARVNVNVVNPLYFGIEDCMPIYTLSDLQAIEQSMEGYYVLADVIGATATQTTVNFEPIGDATKYGVRTAFRGTLDGQGHTIYGLAART